MSDSASGKLSYTEFLMDFSWDKFLEGGDWPAKEKYNLAHEMCDRWANDPAYADKAALRFETKDGKAGQYSFRELAQLSNQCANLLVAQGIGKGDRVGGLLPKNPAVVILLLGTWKLGAVYVPLFTAFAGPAVAYRLRHSETKLIVTDPANLPKVREGQQSKEGLPALNNILLVAPESVPLEAGLVNFWTALKAASAEIKVAETTLDDLLVLQYTSGSTGNPKGAMLTHRLGVGITLYARYAMDIRPDDVFWGAADPGWAYGLLVCLPCPMLMGNPALMIETPFTPELGWQVLERYGVTNFTFAPTGYRAMVAAGSELLHKYTIKLRVCTSAGEPLNPEVIEWFKRELGVPVYDCYGQTELLMIVCNCLAFSDPVKPGSMGRPMPGFGVTLVDDEGREIAPGQTGQIAFDRTSFCYAFKGYLKEPEKTENLYLGNWHLTGDMARLDDDGYYWFEGRSDDLINTSGYRVGPFEIESALLEHPAVTEAAVIAVPDPQRGEAIKAFVTLATNYTDGPALTEELQQIVRDRVGKHAFPRSIVYVEALPKTPSGKIQRFLLRQQGTA